MKFAVSRLRDKPAESFRMAHEGASQVRTCLQSANIEESAVETSRVRLEQTWEFTAGTRKFLGYTARLGYRVRVGDLDALG